MNPVLSIALVAILLSGLLAGCMPELKSEAPPERIYWLETVTLADSMPLRLSVSVVPGLNSDRIWVLEPDQRLNFYAGAFWAENLSPLLESVMTRSLGAQDDGPTIDGPTVDGPAIDVLVERFFALKGEERTPPDVEIRALMRNEQTVCRFESSRTAATDRLRDIVAAHQSLLDSLTGAVAAMARSGTCPSDT